MSRRTVNHVSKLPYDNINQKRCKSWDMRYYWLLDRQNQKQLDINWENGSLNNADYHTKHNPATKHHLEIRPRGVLNDTQKSINTMTFVLLINSSNVC